VKPETLAISRQSGQSVRAVRYDLSYPAAAVR
jgi:hypothetical protein